MGGERMEEWEGGREGGKRKKEVKRERGERKKEERLMEKEEREGEGGKMGKMEGEREEGEGWEGKKRGRSKRERLYCICFRKHGITTNHLHFTWYNFHLHKFAYLSFQPLHH